MLTNITISTRLLFAFLLVSLITLFVGVFGYTQVNKLRDNDRFLYEKGAVPLERVGAINATGNRIRVLYTRDILNEAEVSVFEKTDSRIKKFREEIDQGVLILEASLPNKEAHRFFADFKEAHERFNPILDKLLHAARSGNYAEAKQMISTSGVATTTARGEIEAIDKLSEFLVANAKRLSDDNARVAQRAGWVMLGLTGIGVVVAFLMGFLISRSITVPISGLVSQAEQIAEGDLRVSIDYRSEDEIGQLSNAFRSMSEKLRTTIDQVSSTAVMVATSASQLRGSSMVISSGTDEVASQSNTVATASQEMAATSHDIADNCHQAADSAKHAAETTQRGFDVVKRTVDGIRNRGEGTRTNARIVESLGSRSDQIGAIVATIEDIADQTNLLALNAAIEAARAGEQGRGFAVVADEVRALAERTSRATKEIGEMIRVIQAETKTAIISMEEEVRGTEQGISEAGGLETALHEILEQVNAVTMQMNQIATAAEEQTATTSEITNNIHHISEIIQTTSHSTNDAARAAVELSGKAEELTGLVQRFRL